MKGQISIDYYISLIIFIFFVVYFLFQTSTLVPIFIGQMEEHRIRAESFQLSELLVNDIGSPSNWNTLVPNQTDQIARIGLSDQSKSKTNLVSSSKVSALNTICSISDGQELLRSKLDTDLQLTVFVIDRTDDSIDVNCEPELPSKGFLATTKRVIAFDDGRFGELAIRVWRP